MTDLTPDEKTIYTALWKKHNSDDAIDAGDAVELLRLSGLDDDTLFKVWELSDPEEDGFLDESNFFIAMKLIAVAQAGLDVSMGSLQKLTKLADLGKETDDLKHMIKKKPPAPAPKPKSGIPAAATTSDDGDDSVWAISEENRTRFRGVFMSLGPNADGILSGKRARQVLTKSRLPTAALCSIWEISDIDGDGGLSEHEFAVAMNLVAKCLEGREPPTSLPDCLRPPGSAPPAAAAATATTTATTTATASSEPEPEPEPEPEDELLMGGSDVPWAVSDEEKTMYDKFFKGADKDGDGLVEGGEVMRIFVRSKLEKPTLAFIWELVDINSSGQINDEQFALAMHLISRAVKGEELPQQLTPELMPPSFRTSSSSVKTQAPPPVIQPPAPVAEPASPARPPKSTSNSTLPSSAPTTSSTTTSYAQQETTNQTLRLELEEQEREIEDQKTELAGVSNEIKELKKEEVELRRRLKAGKDELQALMAKVREAKNNKLRMQQNNATRRQLVEKTESSLATQQEKYAHLLQTEAAAPPTDEMGGMSFGDYFGNT